MSVVQLTWNRWQQFWRRAGSTSACLYCRVIAPAYLAFPKQHTTIEACIAEDDLVAVLHTHTGTHTGPFLGLPATEHEINIRGIEFFRIHNDKIVELWRQDDDAGSMRQLGLLPAQAGATVSI